MRCAYLFAMLMPLSCASPSYPEPKPELTPVSEPAMPIVQPSAPDDSDVVVKLVTHDRVLTVVASDHGPRFWVSTRDGRPLGRDLSAEELEGRHRDLANVYRVGTAGAYLDASVDGALLRSPSE